ncbi:hypothetical protein J6590_020265, partial [Homalodisca vitripennis]
LSVSLLSPPSPLHPSPPPSPPRAISAEGAQKRASDKKIFRCHDPARPFPGLKSPNWQRRRHNRATGVWLPGA